MQVQAGQPRGEGREDKSRKHHWVCGWRRTQSRFVPWHPAGAISGPYLERVEMVETVGMVEMVDIVEMEIGRVERAERCCSRPIEPSGSGWE